VRLAVAHILAAGVSHVDGVGCLVGGCLVGLGEGLNGWCGKVRYVDGVDEEEKSFKKEGSKRDT